MFTWNLARCRTLMVVLLSGCEPLLSNSLGLGNGSDDTGTVEPIGGGIGDLAADNNEDGETYEDWWLCANECAPSDAACVDKCTEDFNNTHLEIDRENPVELLPITLVGPSCTPDDRTSAGDPSTALAVLCPSGTTLTPFEMPVYDQDGLFVVDYDTVWFCIEDDLEPAG